MLAARTLEHVLGPGGEAPLPVALGFIMTVYRRRLTSSFEAIRQSLHRRLRALENGQTLQALLDEDDQRTVEDATLDFEGGDELERSAADLLAEEIGELRDFLNSLERLTVDSKTSQLNDDIRNALDTHDTVVVFTQYTDTMDYLRDQLAQQYGRIACYSGRGGELWDPDTKTWKPVTKARLKTLFREGNDVKILIGTDSTTRTPGSPRSAATPTLSERSSSTPSQSIRAS